MNEYCWENVKDNECLEFFGDVVFEFIVLNYLFNKYLDMVEGYMIKMCVVIVCEFFLVEFVEVVYFFKYVWFGKGEEKVGGRICLVFLVDVFELFIGVFYLDNGIDKVVIFLECVIFLKIDVGVYL